MVEVGAAATLLMRGGPNNGVIIKLTGRPITLSRRQDNDVVIDETTVSRRFSFTLDTPRGIVLRALNTTNGTFINRNSIGFPSQHFVEIDRSKIASFIRE